MPLHYSLNQFSPLSCGIRLLGQLDSGKLQYPFKNLTPEENAAACVRFVARNRYKKESLSFAAPPLVLSVNKYSQVVFSHRKKDAYLKALVKFITKHRLGQLTKSPSIINANSGARIITYIWNLNVKNLEKFNVKEPRRKRIAPGYFW